MSAVRAALVTVGGLGHMRPASGTWGSLPPVVMCIAYVALGLPHSFINLLLLVVGGIACAACLEFGEWAEKRYKGKDPSEVVADEVAGQSLTLLFLPWREINVFDDWVWNITMALIAFFMFRIMDIIKPEPARTAQRLRGGEGILIDDLIAGVYALILTQLIARFALEPVLAMLR